jgi:hypothetical protein
MIQSIGVALNLWRIYSFRKTNPFKQFKLLVKRCSTEQAWWLTSVILALGRLKQASPGYIARPYLKKKKKKGELAHHCTYVWNYHNETPYCYV